MPLPPLLLPSRTLRPLHCLPQQHYNLALNWSSSSRPSSRGDASCAQHQLRRSSISSVAAALAGDGSVPRRSAVDGGSSFEMQDVQDVHASPMKQLSCEKNKGYRYFLLINELGKVAHISIKMNWGRRPNQGRHGKPTQTGARETHL